MVRDPVVSGQFYPGSKNVLIEDLEALIPSFKNKIDVIGAVVPHAGYVYSGSVAGEVYGRLKPKPTYILIGPNHTGCGAEFSYSNEPWKTSLGTVNIDGEMLNKIVNKTSLIVEDSSAHAGEHSLEVQLPFIQKTSPEAKIVPITVKYGKLDELKEIASAITFAIKDSGNKAVIIASSDMTHYESRKSAREKDKMAIAKVLALDPEGLLDVVEDFKISMCGYIPSAIMLMCAIEMNAEKAELVKYTDSGEVTGDTEEVVGYAGIIVY